MNDKDYIKELFQKELGNYKAKVDPSLWNGIQAGLGSASAAGVGTTLGLAGKIIIGASIATVITVGSLLLVNNNIASKNEKLKVEVTTNNNKEVQTTNSEEVKSIEKNQSIIGKEKEQLNIQNKEEEKGSDNLSLHSINSIDENPIVVPPVLSNKENEIKSTKQNSNYNYQKPNQNTNVEPSTTQPEKSTELRADLSKVEIKVLEQKNQFVSFSAKDVPEGALVKWNFGDGDYENSLNPEHFYTEAGSYGVSLTVTTDDQKVTKTVQIAINIKGEIGTLPNVFTPNGDGKNDIFFIESKNLKSFQLTVMDKNQKVVYSTNDSNFKWMGYDKFDNPVDNGDYIYIIVAEDEAGNTINKYQKLTIQR